MDMKFRELVRFDEGSYLLPLRSFEQRDYTTDFVRQDVIESRQILELSLVVLLGCRCPTVKYFFHCSNL